MADPLSQFRLPDQLPKQRSSATGKAARISGMDPAHPGKVTYLHPVGGGRRSGGGSAGGGGGGQSYLPPTSGLSADFDGLAEKITELIDRAVSESIQRAYHIAVQRVPVRRVFKGGRLTKPRHLSSKELKAESAMYLALFSPSERATRAAQRYRSGATVATNRPRGTGWLQTRGARRVQLTGAETRLVRDEDRAGGWRTELEPGTGTLSLEMPGVEAMLNKEGRYSMRHARLEGEMGNLVDVGHGAISQGRRMIGDVAQYRSRMVPQLHLGGTLKESIHVIDDPAHHRASVVAGGGRAYYAQYMEFGTRHVAARPFMRPAFAALEQDFPRRVERELRQFAARHPIVG